jgi:hypothetical protein
MVRIDDANVAQELRGMRDMLSDALAKLKQPVVYGVSSYQPAGALADELWRRLGRRKALIVRTRLSQLAEAEDGIRQGGRGRDRVRSNGETYAD